MRCDSCERENRDGARFCARCGAALSVVCPECGTTAEPGARFCDHCGADISSSPAHPTKRSSSAPAQSEGERRVITVLFADAAGHTAISEQIGEEAAYDLMQGCFDRMQTAVEKFGGSVNQFTGDGVLALFGAPIAHEDSARRAVAAALEMQRQLADYAAEVKQKLSVQCAYRIGLNTGPVVVGRISEKLDLEFAAVGDTVNLAARMQTLAEPGSVCLSENTYRAVRDYFDCDDLGTREVKGKSAPVRVYQPVREKPVQTRFDVATRRGLTPYTGREHELDMLRSYLANARSGHGQVVVVSGDAGIGKSRLLLEFRRGVGDEVRWLDGQCISFGEHIPYLPMVGLLKSAFGVEEGDSADQVAKRVTESTTGWSEAGAVTLPYARFLLQIDPGDATVATMDPLERRAGVYDAFRALIRETAARGPVVVAIEDLHWIDERSEEVLTRIVDTIATLPVLVILTTRPGYEHPLGERSNVSRLAVSPLAQEESATLAMRALHASGLPDSIQRLIGEKAEGNPFFIEEVTRSLVETGVLEDTGEGLALARGLDSVQIPDTIHEVILARIDRLDPAGREAIQLASVIGREFTVQLLKRISRLEEGLGGVLEQLKSLELIYEAGYLPELAYMFKHALTHDVAYSTLLTDRRRQLHRTVAEAIEALFADRISEHFEALAHHYERAEVRDKAIRYLSKSAHKAEAAYANDEAAAFLDRAIHLCERQADGWPLEYSLRFRRVFVLNNMSRFRDAIAECNRAIDAARCVDDKSRLGVTLAWRAYIQWEAHEIKNAHASLDEAFSLADSEEVTFAATLFRWMVMCTTGQRREAQRYLPELRDLVGRSRDPRLLTMWVLESALNDYWSGNFEDAIRTVDSHPSRNDRRLMETVAQEWACGMSLCGLGRFREALDRFMPQFERVERVGNWFFMNRYLNTIGWLYNEIQCFDEAIIWNTRGLEHAFSAPTVDMEVVSHARLNLAESYLGQGSTAEAEEQLRQVEQTVRHPTEREQMARFNYSMRFFHVLGEVRLLQGELDAAMGLADECLALAQENFRKKYVARGLGLRGRVKIARGDREEGVDDLQECVALARELRDPTLLWKSLSALGDALQSTGVDGAPDAYDEAAQLIEKIAVELDEKLRAVFVDSPNIQRLLTRS